MIEGIVRSGGIFLRFTAVIVVMVPAPFLRVAGHIVDSEPIRQFAAHGLSSGVPVHVRLKIRWQINPVLAEFIRMR